MRQIKGITAIFLCCLLVSGCDLIDYHPYDVDIKGERDINAKNIQKIEAKCLGKSTIRFIAMGDSQRWYDETVDFVNAVNKRDDIDFVVHGGDFSDFGLTDEFLWQRDIMNKLKVPYVGLIGNHDCLGTGEDAFRQIFGDTNFSFIAGGVKFVCLNTNAMEYDYSNRSLILTILKDNSQNVPTNLIKPYSVCMPVPFVISSITMWPKCFKCMFANFPVCNFAL